MLTKDDLLGTGSERACYAHPLDNTKIIKIIYNQKNKHSDQNCLEYNGLKSKNKKPNHFIF